jgi:hypothetical protein
LKLTVEVGSVDLIKQQIELSDLRLHDAIKCHTHIVLVQFGSLVSLVSVIGFIFGTGGRQWKKCPRIFASSAQILCLIAEQHCVLAHY